MADASGSAPWHLRRRSGALYEDWMTSPAGVNAAFCTILLGSLAHIPASLPVK